MKIATISLMFFLAQNSFCQVIDTIYLDGKFKEVNKKKLPIIV